MEDEQQQTPPRRIAVSIDGEASTELSKLSFDDGIDVIEAVLTERDRRAERLSNARSRHGRQNAAPGEATPEAQPRGPGRPRKTASDTFPRTRAEQIAEAADAEAAQ